MRAQHDRSDGDEGAREAIAGHGEKPTQFRGAEGYCSEMAAADMELVRRSFGGSLESAAAYWDPDLEYVEDPRLPG